jgi:acetyl esterase/lipase
MSSSEYSDGPHVAYTLALTQSIRSSLAFVRDSAGELAAKVGWLLRDSNETAQVTDAEPSPLRKHTRTHATAQSVFREAEALKLTCDAIFPEVERLLAVVAGEPSLSLCNITETGIDPSPPSGHSATAQGHATRRRSPLVGRGWGGAYGSPGNGYESLLSILWHLLQRLEVETALTNQEATERRARQRASGRSPRVSRDRVGGGVGALHVINWRELEHRWLAQRTSTNQLTPLGRMAGHHLQLKQFYAVIHLACRCIQESDVARTLFGPLGAEFDHRVWAPAVKLDSFRGVHFGFQYSRDMRTVLRIVQVIRSAVHRAVSSEYFRRNTLARKIAFLSWGWFYVHLALLENYGYSTSTAQQIVEKLASTFGANPNPMNWPAESREQAPTETAPRSTLVSLDEARMFFNLSEDPLFMGFALVRDKDVAVDRFFEITDAGETLKHVLEACSWDQAVRHGPKKQQHASQDHQCLDSLGLRSGPRQLPKALDGPIKVRLLSYAARPVQIEMSRSRVPTTGGAHTKLDTPDEASSSLAAVATSDCWQPAYEQYEPRSLKTEASQLMSSPIAVETAVGVKDSFTEDDIALETNHDENRTCTPLAVHSTGAASSAHVHRPKTVYERTKNGFEGIRHSPEEASTTSTDARLEQDLPTPQTASQSAGTDERPCVEQTPTSGYAYIGERPFGTRQEPSGSRLASAIGASMRTLGARIDFLLRNHVDEEPARSMIIFMHGGGFIGQSSLTHSSLLKQIAHDVPEAVVLSIDYRLAPEFPYPTAVNECFHCYIWALEHADCLGTRAERVILAGDSAGGNLAVAVTILLIEHGLRLPDGLVLAYPALNLTLQWSPSRLMSAFDPLLSIDLLELILQSYIPVDVNAREDPCLSPCIAASNALLKAFPPVYMVCGAYDPLLDDAAEFAHRLRLVKRDDNSKEWVRLRVYDGMPHGFLSMSGAIRRAAEAVGQVTCWISELLQTSWHGDYRTPSSPWTPDETVPHLRDDPSTNASTPLSDSSAFRQAMRELSFAFSDSDDSEHDSDAASDERVPLFSLQSMDIPPEDQDDRWRPAT